MFMQRHVIAVVTQNFINFTIFISPIHYCLYREKDLPIQNIEEYKIRILQDGRVAAFLTRIREVPGSTQNRDSDYPD
jgi:hypothetical protein